jgi:uncharacterized membrane protein
MTGLLAAFVIPALLVGLPWLLVVLGHWVLGPIDRAAQGQKTAPQFTLADVLGLFFLAQAVLGPVYWVVPEHGAGRAAFCVPMLLVAAVIWAVSVQRLTAAGVRKNAYRVLFTAIVYPFTILGCMGVVILVPVTVIMLLQMLAGAEVDAPLWTLVALPLAAAILAAFAKFTRYVVAQSPREQAEQDIPSAADQDRDDTT